MAKATQVKINVKGVDQTSGVFSKIAAKANALFGAQGFSALVGGTKAAVGAVAAVGAAVAYTANKLGALSDVAQRAGVATSEITRLSAAFNVLGVAGSSPEEIARAFQFMAKNTGRTGLQGFYETVREIAKLPSVAERSKAAMEAFGRSGLNYMPVIEAAAQNGVDALQNVTAAMPGISDAAASAGDAVADSMSIMTASAKSLWADAIGAICERIDGEFSGGVREASAALAAHFEVGVKKAYRWLEWFVQNGGKLMTAIGQNFWKALGAAVERPFMGFIAGGATMLLGQGFKSGWDAVGESVHDKWMEIYEDFTVPAPDFSDLDQSLADRLETVRSFGRDYARAATGLDAGEGGVGGKRSGSSRNELILGGSYRSLTMGLRETERKTPTAKQIDDIGKTLKDIHQTEKEAADAFADFGLV